MDEALVAGLLAGYAIAIPVGPITILIASLAARTSLSVGMGAALVLLGLAVRTGFTVLRGYRDPVTAAPARPGLGKPVRAYVGVLGLTLLNPMTIVYFGALVLGRQAGDGLIVAGEMVFVAAAFTASTSWQLLVAGGGRLAGRLLSGPRGQLATALAASVVIAGLAVWLLH